jgi:hypothetical protein
MKVPMEMLLDINLGFVLLHTTIYEQLMKIWFDFVEI